MPAARDFAAEGGYWRWLGNRARRMIAAGLAGSVRRQAAGYRAVSAWCANAR
jgi:hypothetical protein